MDVASTSTNAGSNGAAGHSQISVQQEASSKKLQHTQAQVNEVVEIMRANVEKVLERDENLKELDYRIDNLEASASEFSQQAGKLKRKYWWKNMKMWIILVGIVVVIIAVIVVWVVVSKNSLPI